MAGFPLLDVNISHLERIISKVETKSYFRLWQTCRDIDELIKTSPNISVIIPIAALLNLELDKDGLSVRHHRAFGRGVGRSLEAFYGARLHAFRVRENVNLEFAEAYDIIKKHRITCADIMDLQDWTTEKCEAILKLLNPVHVNLESVELKQYEAILNLKSVTGVHTRVSTADGADASVKLIPVCSQVCVNLAPPNNPLGFGTVTITELFQMFHPVLQLLLSNSFPHLKEFRIIPFFEGQLTKEEVEKQFRAFRLDVMVETQRGYTIFELKMPPHLVEKLHCSISLKNGGGGYAGVIYSTAGNFVH